MTDQQRRGRPGLGSRARPLALAGALLLAALPACAVTSSPGTLCGSQTLAVSGGAYTLQNNEWGSGAHQCVTTDGSASFTVTTSSLANSTSGAPGGYPSLYKGCHWGACTAGSGLPIQVSRIRAGAVTTSWDTSQPGGSVYNAAYDIWFNKTPSAPGHPDAAELMIWLNHAGPVRPAGRVVASDVILGGRAYDVWMSRRSGWKSISYAMTSGTTSVSNLDLAPLVADALNRGYLRGSWYLIDVEAGFEIWQGGVGLAADTFSVSVASG